MSFWTDLFALHGMSMSQRLEESLEAILKIWQITNSCKRYSPELITIELICEKILKANGWWKDG
jgi:hypothetical protein